jgi:hypothetical protein
MVGLVRSPAPAALGLALPLAIACTAGTGDAERRAAVERAVAAAEGGAPAAAPLAGPVRPAITRATASPVTQVAEPPGPAVSAWASAMARRIDTVDQRSRQQLSVALLRQARDPRQKSQELIADMQWCDEGLLEACLHVGHVLLFNECLYDRARGFYEKAAALAGGLPPAALDGFMVDGRTPRAAVAIGLRFSDPANRDDEQVRSLDGVCGAIAERDRPHWDEMFARYAAGERVSAARAATSEERLILGALRRKMLFEIHERIEALAHVHAELAQGLRARLAAAATGLCMDGDALSCASASLLHALACNLPQTEDAYRRFQSVVDGLDTPVRAQVLEGVRDIIGPARALVEGDAPARDLMLRSMCGRAR